MRKSCEPTSGGFATAVVSRERTINRRQAQVVG